MYFLFISSAFSALLVFRLYFSNIKFREQKKVQLVHCIWVCLKCGLQSIQDGCKRAQPNNKRASFQFHNVFFLFCPTGCRSFLICHKSKINLLKLKPFQSVIAYSLANWLSYNRYKVDQWKTTSAHWILITKSAKTLKLKERKKNKKTVSFKRRKLFSASRFCSNMPTMFAFESHKPCLLHTETMKMWSNNARFVMRFIMMFIILIWYLISLRTTMSMVLSEPFSHCFASFCFVSMEVFHFQFTSFGRRPLSWNITRYLQSFF